MRRLFSYRTATIIMLALLLSAVAYGFAAANTVTAGNAGDGDSGVISGYTVSVKYNLDATDPSTIDTLTLTLNPTTATTVKVTTDNSATPAAGAWTDCSGSGATWTCDFATNPSVLSIVFLRVIAVQ